MFNSAPSRRRWEIRLFGGLQARNLEATVSRFRTQKTGALLAYLAYYLRRSHPREELVEILWPEDEIDAARHKLSVALSSLRQQLEPSGIPSNSVLIADRASIHLNPDAVVTDVTEFERCLRDATLTSETEQQLVHLQRAVEHYIGPLLPGFYEDWVLSEQRRQEALYLSGLRQLLEVRKERREFPEAIQCARRALAVDPLREDLHRELMRLHVCDGQPALALRQYADLLQLFRAELSIDASADSRALAQDIRQHMRCEAAAPLGLQPATQAAEVRPAVPPSPTSVSEIAPAPATLEPVGGAVPLVSPLYIERPADTGLLHAIQRHASIVLLKGGRQVGKTSLLARGMAAAREMDARVVHTDFQLMNATQFASADALLRAVAREIAEQLSLELQVSVLWDPEDSPNLNFRRVMRHVMAAHPDHALVWFLDEVDRLFTCPFGTDIFALFRSWHNERAFDPAGPWSRLTLAIAYAAEAHLFIRDINQSPFNVGVRLVVDDFLPAQVAELNRRRGSPLSKKVELEQLYRLVGGHPYLVQRALREIGCANATVAQLVTRGDQDNWIFGDHLRLLRAALLQNVELCVSLRDLLLGKDIPNPDAFYHLRSSGVLVGEMPQEARFRCELYSRYLSRHLLHHSS